MTAQDQQSRAEFESYHAARFAQPLTRWGDTYANAHVRCRWEGWQAARALPARGVDTMLDTPAGVEPVGEVVLFGVDCKEISWRKGKLPPVGTKLYTAAQVQAMLDAGNPGNKLPPGWQAVPVEPTAEMWRAVNKLDNEMAAGSYSGQGCTIEQAWECFLSYAPRPPAAQEGA